jgi:formate-dependent nitrite reductase membrane component NrfD
MRDQNPEITTSVSLVVTAVLGVLVLTSMASALVNLPLFYRETRQKDVTRTLSIISFGVVLLGLGVLLFGERFW